MSLLEAVEEALWTDEEVSWDLQVLASALVAFAEYQPGAVDCTAAAAAELAALRLYAPLLGYLFPAHVLVHL